MPPSSSPSPSPSACPCLVLRPSLSMWVGLDHDSTPCTYRLRHHFLFVFPAVIWSKVLKVYFFMFMSVSMSTSTSESIYLYVYVSNTVHMSVPVSTDVQISVFVSVSVFTFVSMSLSVLFLIGKTAPYAADPVESLHTQYIKSRNSCRYAPKDPLPPCPSLSWPVLWTSIYSPAFRLHGTTVHCPYHPWTRPQYTHATCPQSLCTGPHGKWSPSQFTIHEWMGAWAQFECVQLACMHEHPWTYIMGDNFQYHQCAICQFCNLLWNMLNVHRKSAPKQPSRTAPNKPSEIFPAGDRLCDLRHSHACVL